MKPLHCASVVLALAGVAAQAQTGVSLVPSQSEISFTTRQMGVPVEGRFGKFDARVALDPKRPDTGSVALTIDTASARFGSAELDGEVGKPIWLAAARFPQASFQSAAIKAVGAGRLEISGRLTIKGATRDVVVPVSLQQAGGQTTASGAFTIKRLDFKVGEAEWADTSLLADGVAVRFKLVLTGVGAL
jgi:polyisoprenoid-binding protein YceI